MELRPRAVDAVFSSATSTGSSTTTRCSRARRAATAGGLSAQCGGEGNIARVNEGSPTGCLRLATAARTPGIRRAGGDRGAPGRHGLHRRAAGCSPGRRPRRSADVPADRQPRAVRPAPRRADALPRRRPGRARRPPVLDYVRLNSSRRAGSLDVSKTMTAQELFEYRHEPYRQELVDGILYEMEPPGAEHALVATRVGRSLTRHVDDADGIVFTGELGFRLSSDPDTVRAPDVAFVSTASGPRDRSAARLLAWRARSRHRGRLAERSSLGGPGQGARLAGVGRAPSSSSIPLRTATIRRTTSRAPTNH